MIEKRFSPVFEFKFAGSAPSGTFSGYASTFNGPLDSYGDIIAPGAFSESLKDRTPAMLWAHNTDEPIGTWTSLQEDRYGLAVEGKLTLATKRAQDVHALMRDSALGLSIGFRVKPGGEGYQGATRVLRSLELFEISAVAIPANPSARVTSVKSACQRPENIRDFEAILRAACGFSSREAKRIASGGWPALIRRDDASEELEELTALLNQAAVYIQPN